MKLSPTTCMLIIASAWLEIARSNVRCALRCGSATAGHQYLCHAREDAARYRSYSAIWFDDSTNPRLLTA